MGCQNPAALRMQLLNTDDVAKRKLQRSCAAKRFRIRDLNPGRLGESQVC